jgi:hypothetical protein
MSFHVASLEAIVLNIIRQQRTQNPGGLSAEVGYPRRW